MRFFLAFFLAATATCGYFLLTDGPGSGMGWPTGIFGGLLAGTLLYNKVARGGWLSDAASLNDRAGK